MNYKIDQKNCAFKCKYCDASCIQFFGIPAFLKRHGLWPFGNVKEKPFTYKK